jgi:hypothetical protein
MSTICSLVKLPPPPAKKGRPSIDWQRCIICQVFTAERLCIRLKALSLQDKQAVQSILETLDRITIVKLSSFDDGF